MFWACKDSFSHEYINVNTPKTSIFGQFWGHLYLVSLTLCLLVLSNPQNKLIISNIKVTVENLDCLAMIHNSDVRIRIRIWIQILIQAILGWIRIRIRIQTLKSSFRIRIKKKMGGYGFESRFELFVADHNPTQKD